MLFGILSEATQNLVTNREVHPISVFAYQVLIVDQRLNFQTLAHIHTGNVTLSINDASDLFVLADFYNILSLKSKRMNCF